ncbi:MAG: NFACT family protein [Fusobacterium sp.]
MLYLDGISLSKIIPELENNILNKKIGKIFQNSSLSLSLNFGKKKLIFSCSPSFPICYITEKKEERIIEENSNFLMILRKHIVNSALKKIEQVGYDRIIKFKKSLSNHGFVVTVRKTRGDDTNSACGQLSGDFMNKIKLQNKTSILLNG